MRGVFPFHHYTKAPTDHLLDFSMHDSISEFHKYRETMNHKILDADNLIIKRFFSLDESVYQAGALDKKIKELLGLVASTVLRCNDCILYHITECVKAGVTDSEFHEAMSIALVVGGSITIPHLRYAFDIMDKVRLQNASHGSST
jgi:AhpD family alkylhydroperoxidase